MYSGGNMAGWGKGVVLIEAHLLRVRAACSQNVAPKILGRGMGPSKPIWFPLAKEVTCQGGL